MVRGPAECVRNNLNYFYMVKHTRRARRTKRNQRSKVKGRLHKKNTKRHTRTKHRKSHMTRRKQRGGNPAPIDKSFGENIAVKDDSNIPISFGYAMATVKPVDLGMANPIPIKSYEQCPSK